LAACKADNYYRPNDYDPEHRKKEIEKKRKEGRLKVRVMGARKIRFEMPFHVRCTECKNMIAKGVRFNAVKKKAGRYLGTTIFEFTMPCTNCKNTIVIKTDPQNCEYLLVSGCIRYIVDYDENKINTIKIQQPDEGEKINKNPFYKLETQKIDIIKAQEQKPILNDLFERKSVLKDDYYINRTLRRKLKMQKNQTRREDEESMKKGLNIRLLPANEDDKV
jgi:coiled-coil domain-containing protein 130